MSDDIERVKWGVIGTANIARGYVIPAIHDSDIAELHAVASRNKKRAEEFAVDNDIPVSYGDYEDLLSDPEIEAVYIPLPNSMHYEWTIKAAKRGKNVLCEKPLSLDLQEAEEMFDVANSQNVLLMEAFMYRFHPQTKRVKELIEEGAIGEPKLIRAGHSFPLVKMNRAEDVRWKKDLGGGSLMDLGCYCINTARYFFNEEPKEVYASPLYQPEFSAEAQLEGILEFSDGKMAMIDSSFLLQHRSKYEVVGDSGKILVDNAYQSEGKDLEIEIVQGVDREIESIDGVDEYKLEVENFSRALRGVEDPLLSRKDSLGNMKTIESLYKSAETDRPIILD